jgi:hypothetical protein
MAADRQLTRDDRLSVIDLRVENVSDTADDRLCGRAGHFACGCHAMPQAFNEKPAVRVQHDFHDAWVIECDAKMIAESVLQLADEAGKRTVVRRHHGYATFCWRSKNDEW